MIFLILNIQGYVLMILTTLGFVACIFIASGVDRLESVGEKLCRSHVLSSMSISALLAVAAFSFESLTFRAEDESFFPLENDYWLDDRRTMRKSRHWQNLLVSAFLLTFWFLAGRLCSLKNFVPGSRRRRGINSSSLSP